MTQGLGEDGCPNRWFSDPLLSNPENSNQKQVRLTVGLEGIWTFSSFFFHLQTTPHRESSKFDWRPEGELRYLSLAAHLAKHSSSFHRCVARACVSAQLIVKNLYHALIDLACNMLSLLQLFSSCPSGFRQVGWQQACSYVCYDACREGNE